MTVISFKYAITVSIQVVLTIEVFEIYVLHSYVFWMYTTPKIIMQDPELIREALTNKSGQFQRLSLPPIHRLSRGLPALEGEGDEWSQHKSIVAPAFHLAKLKVILLHLLLLLHTFNI